MLDLGGKSQRKAIRELKARVNQRTVINFYPHFSKMGDLVGDCSDRVLTCQFDNPFPKDYVRLDHNSVKGSEIIFQKCSINCFTGNMGKC